MTNWFCAVALWIAPNRILVMNMNFLNQRVRWKNSQSFLRIYVYSEILYRHKRAVKVKTLTPLKLRNISQK